MFEEICPKKVNVTNVLYEKYKFAYIKLML